MEGSNFNRFIIKSIYSLPQQDKTYFKECILHLLLKVNLVRTYCADFVGSFYTSFDDGMPMHLRISYNWSRVLLPGKRGVLRTSSASTHPTLHKSMESEQVEIPSNPSGGLYHREAIYSVTTSSFELSFPNLSLAIPKSHIFTYKLLALMRILEGLISRWTIPDRWR